MVKELLELDVFEELSKQLGGRSDVWKDGDDEFQELVLGVQLDLVVVGEEDELSFFSLASELGHHLELTTFCLGNDRRTDWLISKRLHFEF